jgi:hypothetical protein
MTGRATIGSAHRAIKRRTFTTKGAKNTKGKEEKRKKRSVNHRGAEHTEKRRDEKKRKGKEIGRRGRMKHGKVNTGPALSSPCHCERSEAIWMRASRFPLTRSLGVTGFPPAADRSALRE